MGREGGGRHGSYDRSLWIDARWLNKGDTRVRADAASILEHALRAADPREAVRRRLSLDGQTLRVDDRHFDLDRFDRVRVYGCGKAAHAMTLALEDLLSDRIDSGLVVVKHGHGGATRRVRIVEAGHPLPDEAGARAATEMLADVSASSDRDLILFVISGGGSALLPAPASGVTLDDKIEITNLLLRSGAPIQDVNCVRKHLSAVKGGRLARSAAPATVIGLVLSDVLGDPLHAIASGPLSPDPTNTSDAVAVVDRYLSGTDVVARVRRYLERGVGDPGVETPKPGDPVFERVYVSVVGSNRVAVDAAASRARELGYNAVVLTTLLEGEAREVGRVMAAIAKEVVARERPASRPACLIAGGETTVTVRGAGRGGRNQELALAAGLALAGTSAATIVSFATDGTDGPTDAAGGVADGGTAERARLAGIDLRAALAANDAYTALVQMDDLMRTIPTGTNVNDLALIMVGGEKGK